MVSPNSRPLASIIILNYNGKNYLEDCIASVLQTSYPNFEVVLVDNASTDHSLKAVKENFGNDSRLKIIENPVNSGFSGGNNIGFSHCSGEYIAFLNNDTTVEPDWLTHLINALESDVSIGLAQSVILTIDGSKIKTAGFLYSDYLVVMHNIAEGKASSLQFKSVFDVSVASGTSMITRRDLIDEMGLFEPVVPFFYDDTLLSFKVWLVNKKVVTVPASRIRHIGGATSLWNIRFTSYNFLKAKLCLTFDVYYSLSGLSKALFVNFFTVVITSVLGLRQRNFDAIFANLKGLMWGLGNFGFLWRNRLNHWSKNKVSPSYLKEKFVRVKVPLPFYLLPSQLGSDFFSFETRRYEEMLIKKPPAG